MQEGLLTLYSEVESSPVRWLWYPYIAIGKITLLQGDPGDGKSTMMMNLIAEITTGGAFPDGKPLEQPQRVIYQCSEDGVADTIKPRLEEQGADCSKVAFINEEVNSGLTLDDERIRDAIVAFRPRLVVIDPIQADALRWCIAKPDKRKSRKMSCRLFSELLYKEMDWSGDCRYKILGYRIEFEGEALYVFDLVAAEVFHECKKKQSADQQPTTVAEENTEEQPVNPRKGYYPDDIAGTFGMPVEQHRQESELRQMDGFVSVGMLTGMPGQQQNL